jgi:uncharacterized repeat protein (TIGR03803 family)
VHRKFNRIRNGILVCGLALAVAAPIETARAKGFRVLYAFKGGSDGSDPFAPLVADGDGNLFGTTTYGGGSGCGGSGCGTVFMLAKNGAETVLHVFAGSPNDGGWPQAAVIRDKTGNLFGTTIIGGLIETSCQLGCGTVFKIAPGGNETVLHAFTGGSDGQLPDAPVIADRKGNLTSTAFWGDNSGCDGGGTCGNIFKLATNGTESQLYDFTNAGGANPAAGLIADKAGNLYGTAFDGGSAGYGAVFMLAPNGVETVLHSFTGSPGDGAVPEAGLIRDGAGNLYGTTGSGGQSGCSGGCGVVFKIAADGAETVLHAFTGGSDGGAPQFAGVIMDASGNLYGTTQQGGAHGNGVVFKLAPNGKETVLHAFTGGSDGAQPFAGLIADRKGYLYGTTWSGGANGVGIIFKLKE